MRLHYLLPGLISLLWAGALVAEPPRTAPLMGWVEVAADGQLLTIHWHPDVLADLRPIGERALVQHPFQPAQGASGPAASRSWLTGNFVLRNDGDRLMVSIRGLAAGPMITHYEAPRFPRSASRKGEEGMVVARFTVATEGRPKGIVTTVLKGDPAFGERVRDALEEWRFEREQIDGIGVDTPMCVPFAFAFAGRPAPVAPGAEHCTIQRNGPVAPGQTSMSRLVTVTMRGQD